MLSCPARRALSLAIFACVFLLALIESWKESEVLPGWLLAGLVSVYWFQIRAEPRLGCRVVSQGARRHFNKGCEKMKRCFLCVMILILPLLWSSSLTLAQNQPGPAGRWEGSVDLQHMKLGIIVSLTQTTDGAWTGTITVPSQRFKDSALANVSVKADLLVGGVALKDKSLRLEMKRLGASYEGMLSQDGSEISGQWEQNGFPLPLTFRRLAGNKR